MRRKCSAAKSAHAAANSRLCSARSPAGSARQAGSTFTNVNLTKWRSVGESAIVHRVSRMRWKAALAAALLVLIAALGVAAQPAGAKPRVMIALVPQEPLPKFPLLFDFEDRGFAVGLTSPTLGGYSKRQMLLDIGQGARISTRVYDPRAIPDTQLVEEPPGGRMTSWHEIVKRAEDAPGQVEPGLLATTIGEHGGRSAYAGILGFEQLDAIAAADRQGRIDLVSVGTQGTLVDRALELWEQADFVVARLPADELGIEALEELIAARRPDDMIYALRAPPPGGLKLIPTGILARDFEGVLYSPTSRRDGLVTGTDVAPTLLDHLGIDVPDEMQGRILESRSDGKARDVLNLGARLNVVSSRRDPVLQWMLVFWVIGLAICVRLRDRDGARFAVRTGALTLLWLPPFTLLTAAIFPGPDAEVLILTLGPLVAGALTDRLCRWPWALAVPVAVFTAVLTVDLASGSPLLGLSLVGSNPRFGARFFGAGNELEAVLALSWMIGLGAALTLAPPRWAPRLFALATLAGCVVIGAGKLGADVGGVITLGAGGAVATVAAMAGRPSRRTIVIAVLAPVAAVVGLIAIDLVTGGGAHLTRSVVEANPPSEILETIWRRFRISISGLTTGTAPISVGLSIVLLVVGYLRRDDLLKPLDEWDPERGRALRAGLLGAFWATVVGALANDSGPVIVLIGTIGLLLAVGYVRCGRENRVSRP